MLDDVGILGHSNTTLRAPICQSRPGFESPAAISKLGQFCLLHFACLLDETLKAVGPFYMSGEVKDPT